MSSISRRQAALAWALTVAVATGCASRASRSDTPPVAPRIAELRQQLDDLFTAPPADRVLWGIRIVSADRPEDVLYERNPHLLLLPASNTKLLTLAAAAARLGWDFTFETTVTATAPILADGTVRGDLVVRGTGDPTIGGTESPGVLDEWANQLSSAGVRRIEGRIIGDDDAIEEAAIGNGWSWDDLAYGYAAPLGALIYNENTARLRIAPGPRAGAAASVVLLEEAADLEVASDVKTIEAGGVSAVRCLRLPGDRRLEVRGTIAIGSEPMVRRVAVDNPSIYFARALRHALVARGIAVTGEAVDVDHNPPGPLGPDAVTLIRHQSPPLSAMARRLMKSSQNLYAETLLAALGRSTGSDGQSGPQVVADALERWGAEPGSFVIADGSGLSRYNLVSADTVTTVLERMYREPDLRGPWLEALPVAGVDGTLEHRMRGTTAAGNVRAKTGTISYVRALSGYVSSAQGEALTFAILANHFVAPVETADVDRLVEQAVVRLAGFHR